MSGGGGNTSTTVQSNAPPAQFLQAYQNVNNAAQQVASTPYQPYTGTVVAPLSPDQQGAISQIQGAQGIADPFINAAAQEVGQSTTPIWQNAQQFSPQAVQQYESPYTQNVVNATQAEFNNQNAQQQQGIIGNAISAGAWGGDRSAVAQGIVAGQESLAQAPVIAGLENQGYSQALGEFNTQQGAQIGANEANNWLASQAGYGLANLGNEALNTTLTGANAQLGIGGLEQSQAQAELNVPYGQYIAGQAYPFQTVGWLSNIAQGLGGAAGGTASTTVPGPSVGSQVLGAGLAGAGILGQTGAFGSNGYLTGSNGLLSSGSGTDWGSSYGDLSGYTFTGAARGGAIGRADGGDVPDTSISIIPGANGMFNVTPSAAASAPLIKRNYGTTSTTTGGGSQDSTFGTLLKTAGEVAAGIYGGPAGALAAGALSSQVHFADGGEVGSRGIVVPFPRPHVTHGRGIVAANDDGFEPPRQHRAAGGTAIPQIPDSAIGVWAPNNILLPQLGTGRVHPPAGNPVDDYFKAIQYDVAAAPTPSVSFNQASLAPPAAAATAPVNTNAVMGWPSEAPFAGSQWRGGGIRQHREPGGPIIALPDEGGVAPPGSGNWQGISDVDMGVNAPVDRAAGIAAATSGHPLMIEDDGSVPTIPGSPSVQMPQRGIVASPSASPSIPERTQVAEPHADPWSTLTAVGLGILGGGSPFAGVNIGRGGLQGLQFSEQQKLREEQQATRQQQAQDRADYLRGMVGTRQQTNALNMLKLAQQQQLKEEELSQSRQLEEQKLGQDKYTWQPVQQADPNDPTKTITTGYMKLSKAGEPPQYVETDTAPNKGTGAAGGMGSRAEVYFNRVISAGNEAAAAAKNIMELPTTTSRGFFGGREQGPGLLAAAKESLTNSMTSQEVQDYNTMIAGVSRNLAAIEAAGLAPAGSLTHSMDSVILKEGDSELTKMRKMAEIRQIVEKGLEPNLSNPRIPQEQKAAVQNIINSMATAVPFTHHDITQLQQSGNPKQTLTDVVQARGLGSGSTLPQAAIAKLQEGHVTTFQNGQKWMLQNGVPQQVQ